MLKPLETEESEEVDDLFVLNQLKLLIQKDDAMEVKKLLDQHPSLKSQSNLIPDLLDSYKRIASVSSIEKPDFEVLTGIIKELIYNCSSAISTPILEKLINFESNGQKLDINEELIEYSLVFNDFKIFDLGFDINTVNNDGNNALHLAIAGQLPDRVEQLIQRGIDVNKVNKNGVEPFILINIFTKSLTNPDVAISILKLLVDSHQIDLFKKPKIEPNPRYYYLLTNRELLKNYDDPRVQSLLKQVFQSPQFSINGPASRRRSNRRLS